MAEDDSIGKLDKWVWRRRMAFGTVAFAGFIILLCLGAKLWFFNISLLPTADADYQTKQAAISAMSWVMIVVSVGYILGAVYDDRNKMQFMKKRDDEDQGPNA